MKALIENIIYHNDLNYYSVIEASSGGERLTLVGSFPLISAGETIDAEGEYEVHPLYGRQFRVYSYSVAEPEEDDQLIKYLAGSSFKGIGPKLAKRIVDAFHQDTLSVIEEEPEKLVRIRGISRDTALALSNEVRDKKGMRDAVMFMQGAGIGPALASRIYERYGPFTYAVLKDNPYRIAEEIDGIGFRTVDAIARHMGIDHSDKWRIRTGILYTLTEAAGDGHCFLPLTKLKERAEELLDLGLSDIEDILTELMIEGKIVLSGSDEVYFAAYYQAERNIALMLKELSLSTGVDLKETDRRLKMIEETLGMELDSLQKEAVQKSEQNGFLVITGGPGTGKTTLINALIGFYEEEGFQVALAAPTGRAAKRITEATGHEAKTIHRLLEYTGMPEKGRGPGSAASEAGSDLGPGGAPYGGSGNAAGAGSTAGKGRFLRDEKDPLEADVLIIDEASMIDIFLMEALLKAATRGTRLILVGDSDQLPSVGAGNVLKDIINSGVYPLVRLTHIHRQAAESDIVLNAHRINHGESVDLSKKSRDFLFIRADSAEAVARSIESLITAKLPPYVGCEPSEIEVISATRKGALGVESLNKRLQLYLNPPDPSKSEISTGDTLIRLGDKVMQTKNNYELKWTVYDERGLIAETGYGVFNGDIGRVADIDIYRDSISVVFDETREVVYERKDMRYLELAYAVTVHKSQGSEYPAVVMPMTRGPKPLMNRNLLYTAVTRAKKCVVLVGVPAIFEEMKGNESENKRYTGLKDRILEESAGDF